MIKMDFYYIELYVNKKILNKYKFVNKYKFKIN